MRAFLCTVAIGIGLGACSDGGEVKDPREWRPEDHGQPAQVDPARAASEPPPSQPADPTRAAAALWKVACAGCHGMDGRGGGPSLPSGATAPVMTDPAWQSARSDQQMAEAIRDGRNLMPAFGKQITDDGIKALVAHIRALRP